MKSRILILGRHGGEDTYFDGANNPVAILKRDGQGWMRVFDPSGNQIGLINHYLGSYRVFVTEREASILLRGRRPRHEHTAIAKLLRSIEKENAIKMGTRRQTNEYA